MRKISIILIALILCLKIDVFSQTTAAALDISANASEKNLGYGAVAINDNINGVSYNPSVIPNMESISGSFTHLNYLSDFSLFYGNFIYPKLIKGFNVLGKIGYFYMPSIIDIESGSELAYHEFFFGTGTGYRFFNKKLSIGAIANFYTSKIGLVSGSTFFFDAGASYPVVLPLVGYHKFVFGFSLLNIGPGIKYIDASSSLPSSLNLGIQYIYDFNYKLFAGFKKYTDYEGVLFGLGGEVTVVNFIFLRASLSQDISKAFKYNMGIGFDMNYSGYHFLLDYGYLPLEGGMESSSIFTLSFKFPLLNKEEKESGKDEENWKNLWTTE